MNRIDLTGRVAVVTGGARGIGRATAERLLDSGAAVALWDLDGPRLEAAVAELGERGQVSGQQVDVADEASVGRAARASAGRHGGVHILVNNAGITGGNGRLWELPPETWRQVLEVNLVGPYLACRALVPEMLRAGWGRIVNVASVAGKEGNPNASHYSASKAGLIGMTKSLAKELATANVLVNCVTPAAARTEIFDQMAPEHIAFMLAKIPMGRLLQVEEVAGLIAWLCSEECAFSTGAVFDISGGRATY